MRAASWARNDLFLAMAARFLSRASLRGPVAVQSTSTAGLSLPAHIRGVQLPPLDGDDPAGHDARATTMCLPMATATPPPVAASAAVTSTGTA